MVALNRLSASHFHDYAALAEQFNIPANYVDKQAQRTWKLLGEGAYGQVLLGAYRNHKVAVKCLKERLHHSYSELDSEQQLQQMCLQHLWNEITLLRTLQHPNIVSFWGAAQAEDNLYMFTEFCERGSVDRLLYRPQHPQLDITRILKICTGTARAMAFLHSQAPALLHCDLKPANLLVTRDWSVKVADFGNSRLISDPGCLDLEGTIEYCAPEVLAGGSFTKAADVWSFGVTLWELLMQQRPYQDCGVNRFMLIMLIASGSLRLPTVTLSSAPAALIHIMEACLDPCPEARPSFQTILEMLEDVVMVVPTKSALKNVDESKSARMCDFEVAFSTEAACQQGQVSTGMPHNVPLNATSSPNSRASSPFAMYAACVQSSADNSQHSTGSSVSGNAVTNGSEDKNDLHGAWSYDSFACSSMDGINSSATNCVAAPNIETCQSSSASARSSHQLSLPCSGAAQSPFQVSYGQMYTDQICFPEQISSSDQISSLHQMFSSEQISSSDQICSSHQICSSEQISSSHHMTSSQRQQICGVNSCISECEGFSVEQRSCLLENARGMNRSCTSVTSTFQSADWSQASCSCIRQGRVPYYKRKFSSVDGQWIEGGLCDKSPGELYRESFLGTVREHACEENKSSSRNHLGTLRCRDIKEYPTMRHAAFGMMEVCTWGQEKLQHRRGLFLDKG